VAHARLFAGATTDRALDVLARHVVGLRFGDDRPEPRVGVDVAATVAGGHRQFLDDAGKDLAPLGVSGALLVLDCVPLGMARHAEPQENTGESGPVILADRLRRLLRRPPAGGHPSGQPTGGFLASTTQTSARGSQTPPR